jgi:ferredoxin
VKIVIDHELCEGNAVCEALAPDVFAVENDDQARLLTGELTEAQQHAVLQAAAGCPRLAISVSD